VGHVNTTSGHAALSSLQTALAGRYVFERELGRGGMATVYLARDVRHDRDVALKVLRPDLGQLLGAQRFLAEIKLTARLQHPNILPLFDSGAAGELLYYVMPYVRGESLREKLTRERSLGVDDAVAIARGIAAALQHAHRHGVVHRDIKPENVLLSDGVPIVADFGVARALAAAGDSRATQAGMAIGTPAYMSPEQAMGEGDVDHRADLYSVGCVLFEMLTGDVPYPGATAAVVRQHLMAAVPSARLVRANVPAAVDAVIMRALAKDREDRFSSAAEMSAALVSAPPIEPMPDYSKVAEPVTRSTSPFVGRRKELAELFARLDALPGGRGGLVLIGGEPGVGKTKLTEAVLLEARARGHVCVVGHCYEMDCGPPYLPFLEQLEYAVRTVPPGRLRAVLGGGAAEIARIMPGLRQLYPDILGPLDLPPDQQRSFLFRHYRNYLQRGSDNVPLVALFDDLHWADESTLLLLEFLAPHLARMRILVLGTYRDEELDVARPFASSLERLTRQRLADRLSLRRMPESDVADLLALLGAPEPPATLVRAIFAETEGNPFFVEEVFRHLNEEGRLLDATGHWRAGLHLDRMEVPEGVRLVIGRRLQRVSAGCRAALTAAAVIGPRFDLALLEAVGDVEADALLQMLEEAERAGLVIAQQGKRKTRYGFAHELIRHTLIETLSLPRRLKGHRRTAEAMEKVYADRLELHACDLAYQFFQSGSQEDEEKTTRYLLLAGRRALAAGAFEEALAQAEKAFSILETADSRRLADLLWVKGSALRGLGKWSDAKEAYLRALDRYEALGAQTELLQLACTMAEIGAGHLETAALVARVLRATDDTPSTDRARLLAYGGRALAMSGHYVDGMTMSDRAVAMATAIGDTKARADVLSERTAILQSYGRIADATPSAIEAFVLLNQTSNHWGALWGGSRVQWCYRFNGRPRDVVSMGDDLLRQAVGIGHVGVKLTVTDSLFRARWMLAPHVDLLASAATTTAREFAEFGTFGEATHLFAAWDHFERDDGADPGADLADKAEGFGYEIWRDTFWAAYFAFSAHTHPERALAILDANAKALPTLGQPAFIGAWSALRWVLLGLVRLGERTRAATLYPYFQELERMGFVVDAGGLTETYAGIAAAAGERWDAAERHFERALRAANEMPHVPEQADVRYWHAWMLHARNAAGDVERARVLIEEALPMFERAGRKRRKRESEELLGACGRE